MLLFINRFMIQYWRYLLILLFLLSLTKSKDIPGNDNKTTIDVKKIQKYELIPMINKSFPNQMKLEYFGIGKYKLGVCLIGKNFSSIMSMILCSLIGSKDYSSKYQFNDCGRSRRYISAQKMAITNKLKNVDMLFKKWNILMIVRNPVERLISGFMQLCYYRTWLRIDEDYCYNCKKNITCFVDKLHHELINVSSKKKIPNQFNDYHFYPQTWQCEYYKFKKNYIYLKYPSKNKNIFYDELMKVIQKSGVSKEHIQFLLNKVKTFNTYHTTADKNDTKKLKDSLFEDIYLMRKICSIFYYDFIEFGFEFPKQCSNINFPRNDTLLS